jgi:hypothetical protein
MMPMTLHLMSPLVFVPVPSAKEPEVGDLLRAVDRDVQRIGREDKGWSVLESGRILTREEQQAGAVDEIPAGTYLFAQFLSTGNPRKDEGAVLDSLNRFGSGELEPSRDIFIRSVVEDNKASIQVYWRVS